MDSFLFDDFLSSVFFLRGISSSCSCSCFCFCSCSCSSGSFLFGDFDTFLVSCSLINVAKILHINFLSESDKLDIISFNFKTTSLHVKLSNLSYNKVMWFLKNIFLSKILDKDSGKNPLLNIVSVFLPFFIPTVR